MRRRPYLSAVLVTVGALAASGGSAQRSPQAAASGVRLSTVITAFLVDSGVRTRGLPWTTGSQLAVKWATPAPVANPDESARRQGLTHARLGTFTGLVGDSVALPMTISMIGTADGLARLMIDIPSLEFTRKDKSGFFVTREMVERALKDEAMTLQPVKCQRAKEGASYGNLIDAVRSPGKTASGLWWYWDSPQQVPRLMLTILYRRTDMNMVECQGH